MNAVETQHLPTNLLDRLAPELQAVLSVVKELDPHAHIVGGSVRDLLLKRPSRDLDFVSETPATISSTALQARLGGKLTCHETFLTCTLELPNLALDFATARTEIYTRPGALPEVTPGTLSDDLYRRDFSVNTFALNLNKPHTLLSVAGAVNDLGQRLLRILHDRSFFDDPTRIVRGARLAGRLEFRYDAATEAALTEALEAEVYTRVSPSRLKNELFLTLAEPEVAPALTYLDVSGALIALYGLKDTPLARQLDALKTETNVSPESYLLALLLGLSPADAAQFVKTFTLPKRLLAARTRLLEAGAAQTEAEQITERVVAPGKKLPGYRQVRGSDVLSLGLSAGPEVGGVLALLEKARQGAQVASFADELALARHLVHDILEREQK